MDRPDLMYDVFEEAQIISKGEIIDADSGKFERRNYGRREESEEDFCHITGFLSPQQAGKRGGK